MKLGTMTWGNLLQSAGQEEPLFAEIDRTRDLGCSWLGAGFLKGNQSPSDSPDPDYMARATEYAAKNGVTIMPTIRGTFGAADPEARKQAVASATESLLTVQRHTGAKLFACLNWPMTHTRFVSEPPLAERFDMIAENLGKVADAAAEVGVVIALENHCDYRGHEIATILEKANRPNLKAQIDTGNAFVVFEEPVDCAKAMAKWVVSVHLKDLAVTPLAPPPWNGPRGESVALGEGHVDNLTICKVLAENSVDMASLPVLIEPLRIPEGADAAWFDYFWKTSLDWCRANLAEYLS
jgi:sugar phosphate isomerase/epimerase